MTATLPTPGSTVATKKLFLVDDHPVFREGLCAVLRRDPALTIVGEASSAAEALLALADVKPDLLLIDLGLPDQDGTELIKQIAVAHPGLPVLVISMHNELLYAERVLAAGGKGYLMKQEGAETILSGIRKVLSGQIHLSERAANALLRTVSGMRSRDGSDGIAMLTEREFAVFQLIGRGKTCRDIAQELNLSVKTVNTHRGHIKRKFNLQSSAQLIQCAVRYAAAND